MFTIVVSGSREATDQHIRPVLDALADVADGKPKPIVLVHGNARGVDTICDFLSQRVLKWRSIPVPALWHGPDGTGPYNMAAGVQRNQRMLDEYKPDVLVAFPINGLPNKGTNDMIRRARKAGIEVVEVPLRLTGPRRTVSEIGGM